MLPWEMLDMSAARVPLMSTLSMSKTVVKSSLWQEAGGGGETRGERVQTDRDSRVGHEQGAGTKTVWGTPDRRVRSMSHTDCGGSCTWCQGRGSSRVQNWREGMGMLYLLDCMSTVPLMMISRRSTAHSVVCWVLRCTVSNMPPTCQGHNKSVRWLRGGVQHLRKA